MVNKSLELSDERYLPFRDPISIYEPETHYEHFHRYCFASKFVKDKVVLDLGCGEGYGSNILSKSARYVIGIDYNGVAIKHCRRKYEKSNLKFIQEAQTIADKANIDYYMPALMPSEPRLDCGLEARRHPYIDVSGDVYPCCILYMIAYTRKGTAKPFGNLHQNTMPEIWKSKLYRSFREAFFTGKIPDLNCLKCSRYYNVS